MSLTKSTSARTEAAGNANASATPSNMNDRFIVFHSCNGSIRIGLRQDALLLVGLVGGGNGGCFGRPADDSLDFDSNSKLLGLTFVVLPAVCFPVRLAAA